MSNNNIRVNCIKQIQKFLQQNTFILTILTCFMQNSILTNRKLIFRAIRVCKKRLLLKRIQLLTNCIIHIYSLLPFHRQNEYFLAQFCSFRLLLFLLNRLQTNAHYTQSRCWRLILHNCNIIHQTVVNFEL